MSGEFNGTNAFDFVSSSGGAADPQLMTGNVLFRLAGSHDLEATYEVFVTAANELHARTGRPPIDDTEQRRAWALPFRRHALAHDPERFWVAEAGDRIVGFSIATLREHVWYLAALHVLADYQARGVGRELLRRCLAAGGDAPGVVRTVISEAVQPTSNALYAKHGLYQWMPLIHVTGAVQERLDNGEVDHAAVSDAQTLGELDSIDRVVLGMRRTTDHRYWTNQPNLTCLSFRLHGAPIGYAYVSASGQIGPLAARAPQQIPRILSTTLRFACEQGLPRAALVVPGHCHAALAYLLDNGFRYGDSINLLLASRPFGRFDRYLVSAVDALL